MHSILCLIIVWAMSPPFVPLDLRSLIWQLDVDCCLVGGGRGWFKPTRNTFNFVSYQLVSGWYWPNIVNNSAETYNTATQMSKKAGVCSDINTILKTKNLREKNTFIVHGSYCNNDNRIGYIICYIGSRNTISPNDAQICSAFLS